jgi:adenosylcobinamide kinase/adenosylcobinamide-phosphate guanylyltransferase
MIHLVLGGARSGKSLFAEQCLQQVSNKSSEIIYIATATADDDEMTKRIDHHQQRRPNEWRTIEQPKLLSAEIAKLDATKSVMIDCMTLWLSNWLCAFDASAESDESLLQENVDHWQQESTDFFQQLKSCNANVVIVSNEVGSGIVPLGELSRTFVDHAGWLNQSLAKLADQVTLVVAGCPMIIKPAQKI